MSPEIQKPNRSRIYPVNFQKPRTVYYAQIFWLTMHVNFTAPAVANELKTAMTEPEGFPIIVRSAWSDLASCRVRFTTTSDKREYSDAQNPITTQVGNSDKVLPLLPWEQPIELKPQARLRGDFINSASETGGTVNLYGEIIGSERPMEVTKSQWYRLLVNLTSTSLIGKTVPVDEDMLVWGAATNAASSAILGQVTDESTNYAWSAEQIPILAWAGSKAQVQPILRYHRPYLLRAQTQLRVEFSAAVASQYVTFICERLLR